MNLRKAKLEVVENLKHWLAIESSVVARNARINWIKVRDYDSYYFYAFLKAKTSRIMINNEGKMHDGPTDIVGDISGFYKSLLGSATPSLMNVDLRCLRQGVQVSKVDAYLLSRPLDRAEVKIALFTMQDNKAREICGFNTLFFKKCWSIIGEDVSEAVIAFSESSA